MYNPKKYNSQQDKVRRIQLNKKIIEKFYSMQTNKNIDIEYYNMLKNELNKYIKNKKIYQENN